MEENKVEFNYTNIMSGSFGGKGGKVGDWEQFASSRLLLESGQELSEEATSVMKAIPYKWYYYNRRQDNNQGDIIIGLHKKDIEGWVYLRLDNITGEVTEFKKIVDAKDSFKEVE